MVPIYRRIVHLGVKAIFSSLTIKLPEVIEGAGSVKQVAALIRDKHLGKPLIVTGPNIYKHGLLNEMLVEMDQQGVPYAVFSNLQANPTDTNVEDGLQVYLENNCTCLVAFGGGSPMDCSKAIGARVVNPRKTVSQMVGMNVHKKIPPLIAIPTTSGTGSETTIYAVITEASTHHKQGIGDPAIMPAYAVLDPNLVAGLPPHTTAATGMDALCHAVEAYTNHTYKSAEERREAQRAVRLIYDNLYKAYCDGGDMEARINMQRAAFSAGVAFNRGMTGYVHCIGHTLSGLYGLPHGLTMAVILPHVMRQFGTSVYDRLAELADVCSIGGASTQERALHFIEWIESVNAQMGIPAGFDVIREEDIPQMIRWAMHEGLLDNTPVVWAKKDFETCIRSLML